MREAWRRFKGRSVFKTAGTSGGALSDPTLWGFSPAASCPPKLRDLLTVIPVPSYQVEYVEEAVARCGRRPPSPRPPPACPLKVASRFTRSPRAWGSQSRDRK